MELVINLGYDTRRVNDRHHSDQFQSFHGGVLSGAHSQFSVIDVSNLGLTISAHFKPGGAEPPLLRDSLAIKKQMRRKRNDT